ncbi:Forkhead box protein Olike, partial [Caligus rogercresseyi]
VMSPSLEHHHHPPSSPGIVNSRHQFSSSTTSSNPPSVDINPHQGGEPLLSPQAANMAYYSQTHQPQSSSNNNNSNTHASPESPVVRAPSTGSSSASGSILERALASSVKSEANPGSPHPEWARSTGGAPPGSNYGSGEVVEEYMKSEYASSSGGGGEYPGYPPPPTPD